MLHKANTTCLPPTFYQVQYAQRPLSIRACRAKAGKLFKIINEMHLAGVAVFIGHLQLGLLRVQLLIVAGTRKARNPGIEFWRYAKRRKRPAFKLPEAQRCPISYLAYGNIAIMF